MPSLQEKLQTVSNNTTKLYLSKNQLTGSIPDSISNLSNLQKLSLYENQLTGSIPDSISNLSNLQELYLYKNQLTGSIPDSISNLTNLQELYLWGNELTGSIPDSISNLSNLQELYLYENQLTGSIPDSISNLSKLTFLYLSKNQLTGSIPDSISNLSKLQYLYLYENQLTGSIPDSISNLTNLQILQLNNNELIGKIPESLTSLKKLRQINLQENYFTPLIEGIFSKYLYTSEIEKFFEDKINLKNSFKNPQTIKNIEILDVADVKDETIEIDINQKALEEQIKLQKLLLEEKDNIINEKETIIKDLKYNNDLLINRIKDLETQLSSKNNIIKQKETIINTNKDEITELKQTNETLNTQLQGKDRIIIDKDKIIEEIEKERYYYKRIYNNRDTMMYSHLQFKYWMLQRENIEASDFTNIELKGKGCDGLVMKASFTTITGTTITVALKMIVNIHGKATLAHEQTCANEFRILPELLQLHPNIVSMFGKILVKPTIDMINYVGEDIRDLCYRVDGITIQRAQFFVLQYYDKTLKSIIKNIPVNKVIQYATHLARGLLFLRESKIVHLDIKTDNLMISDTDELVIVDFGMAGKLENDNTVDIRKTIGGNMDHLAPEVIIARNNGKSLPCEKQYSWELGVVIYEMLSKGDHPIDAYASSIQITPLELDGIPIQFHELLTKLICYEKDRISIQEAWNELETLNQQIKDNQ